MGEIETNQGSEKYILLKSILNNSKILHIYTQIIEVRNNCARKKLALISTIEDNEKGIKTVFRTK